MLKYVRQSNINVIMKFNLSYSNIRITLLVLNIGWIISMMSVFIILPISKSPFAEIRSKIESTQSVEDLRSRTEHLISAMESQEKFFVDIHELLNALLIYGGIITLANVSALYYKSEKSYNKQ